MELKPDIDGEKGGWILAGIMALAGIVRTYIVRTKATGGSFGENMTLIYRQTDALVERYKTEAESAGKRHTDCEKDRLVLLEHLAEMRTEVALLRQEVKDLKEELKAFKGEA